MNINGIMVAGDLAGSSDSNVVVSISGSSPINITPIALQWANSTIVPILTQVSSATAAGQNLTIQAQGSTGSTTNGGNLVLASGSSLSGTVGNIQLQLGNTTGLSLLATGALQFSSSFTGIINQATAATTGTNLAITAQSAGGSGNNGGALILTSGSSTTTGTSGNVTFNTATPGTTNTGNILFQISGTTQAFITNGTSSGLGIGSTPGTSPTVTSGAGVPSSTQPNGSLYLNTTPNFNLLYTRQGGTWNQLNVVTGSYFVPLTETTITNTGTASVAQTYTVDTTGGSADGIILHNHTGAYTTYVMPAPTAGRQIVIKDITGTIETTNQTGGLITGNNATSNVIFIAPHATEKFNNNSGYALTGSAFHFTQNLNTVSATSSKFTTELAPGMSIVPVGGGATTTVSYIIASITNATTLTLTTNYTGTTSTTANATTNSLAYYANYGTLTLTSNGTDWFASSNKPLRAYFTATVTNGVFIPSPGCLSATLIGCGGGGGGGGGAGSGAGGGGGGALQSLITIPIIPNFAGGYAVTIGAGGTGGGTGAPGNPGGTTTFGATLASFGGASPGGASGNATANIGSGGYPFSANNGNTFSSTPSGVGTTNITSGTTITSNTFPGMMAMGGGGSQTSGANNISAGFTNIMGNGSYTGGTAGATGGGGGGAGPQGNGGNGNVTAAATAGAANSGAGGGGGNGSATAGASGGSGYLYILLPM